MFKQFIRRKEKLKEAERAQEQELPPIDPQSSLNCIPFSRFRIR